MADAASVPTSVVDFERREEIGFITLNNPQKRNVLSRAALRSSSSG